MVSALDRGWGHMIGYLRTVPYIWLLCWLLLPNLAIIAMWPIGGPSMGTVIIACGLLSSLVGFSQQLAVRLAGMIAVYAITMAIYLTTSFNMSLVHISGVHEYIMELNPVRSPEYMVAGVALVVSFMAALAYASRKPLRKSAFAQISAVLSVMVLAGIDYGVTWGTRGSYATSAPEGTPINSASLQNTVSPTSVSGSNLVVVVVESWGVPNNAHDQHIDDTVWDTARWEQRYDVSRGTTPYFGSTTNAEVRELCSSWEDHEQFDFDAQGATCLPQRFAEEGFRTVAMHSFAGIFFDRYDWYPKVGFQEAYFENSLLANGAQFCDGVFAGACDRDVPAQITQLLQSSDSERNLVYWLTVNAHIPVAANTQLRTDQCDIGDAMWREEFPMLCRSYSVHQQVADALTREIMRPDFPNSDILIVGDHMPPFFQRDIRTRFDSRHVPWIYLRSRDNAPRPHDATIASAPRAASGANRI